MADLSEQKSQEPLQAAHPEAAKAASQEPLKEPLGQKNQSNKAKLALLAGILLLIAALVAVSWLEFLDKSISSHLRQVLAEALVAFASSKTITAGISLLKGIELNVGIGVTGTVAPFAFLEPIAEVADDFGDLMRVSIVSIILQEFLLVIVGSIYFKVIISLAGIWLAASIYIKKQINTAFWSFKTFVFVIFLRFSVLIAVGLSIGVNHLLLEQTMGERIENVNAFAHEIDINSEESGLSAEEKEAIKKAANDRTFLGELKDSASKLTSKIVQLKNKIQETYSNLGDLVMDMMFVMAAFLFRTLIMPLGFLYVLLLVFRKVWGMDYKTAFGVAKDKLKQDLAVKQ